MNEEIIQEVPDQEKLKNLQEDWYQLIRSYNLDVDEKLLQETFVDIVAQYSQKGRFYHDLFHIDDMLQWIERFRDQLHDRCAVKLAVWFHDAIYDPQSRTNEEDSARYGGEVSRKLGIPDKVIGKMQLYVNATKRHEVPPDYDPDDHDLPLFLDFDLSILAANPARYDLYARQIRMEYRHRSDEEYRNGRDHFLTGMLDRQRIFMTDEMRPFEQQAIANMERERRFLLS